MKRVLLTGATGFIGRHVLDVLQSMGRYEIHAVRCMKSPALKEGVVWHQVDLLDPGRVSFLLEEIRPDFLMHFAWCTEHGYYRTSEKNLSWEKASIGLIKAFHDGGGRRFIGAGTCAEYSWRSEVLSENKSLLAPSTLYGQCKLRVGSFLSEYSKNTGLSSAWGRIFFLYGPYEDPRRLVPSVICRLLQNRPVLCSHGERVRDFSYVEDVASAFVCLLESDAQGFINIASGQSVTIKDIVNTIGDKLNKREFLTFGEYPDTPNEPKMLLAEVKRLNCETDWKPCYDIETGLEMTIDWWKERSIEEK